MPFKTLEQCKYKWKIITKCIRNNNKSVWNDRENKLLYRFVNERGAKNWKMIADELNKLQYGKTKRKAKQCREKWFNCLNPEINRYRVSQ